MFYVIGDTHGDFRRYYDFMTRREKLQALLPLDDVGLLVLSYS